MSLDYHTILYDQAIFFNEHWSYVTKITNMRYYKKYIYIYIYMQIFCWVMLQIYVYYQDFILYILIQNMI